MNACVFDNDFISIYFYLILKIFDFTRTVVIFDKFSSIFLFRRKFLIFNTIKVRERNRTGTKM